MIAFLTEHIVKRSVFIINYEIKLFMFFLKQLYFFNEKEFIIEQLFEHEYVGKKKGGWETKNKCLQK